MIIFMIDSLKKDKGLKIIVFFFILLTLWWSTINITGLKNPFQNYFFGAIYGLMALGGGLYGLSVAVKWGGFRSAMGRAILFFSLGLLFQEFGQLIFSYYNMVLGVEVPYPSIADIGFFGTIPFYIIGALYLARASGVQFSLKRTSAYLQIIIIPVILLITSYLLFLKDYKYDFTQPMQVFLDFGYPMGQAIYLSIAILVYSLSKNLLGGYMKNRILLLILAFFIQYLADYNFLFQNSRGTWVNAGYGDYLYLLAYFMLTLGIFELNAVYHKFIKRC